MLDTLKNFVCDYILPPPKRARGEKLLRIISPHVAEWTPYSELVDIVKREAPEMYRFGEGAGAHMSGDFQADLSALCVEDKLEDVTHFRKSPLDPYARAYRIPNSYLRLIIRLRIRYLVRIQPSDGEKGLDLSGLEDV